MSVIHISKRENPYAQIDKRVLEDPRLSWRAKGILAYLLSKPSGWKVNVKDIWNNGAEGRNAVQDCLVELQMIGYAELKTVIGEHGKLGGSQWVISEEPKGGFSVATDKPKTGKPTNRKSGSRAYSNNEEVSNNELSESENEHTPAPESENLKAESPLSPKVAPKGSFPSGPAQFPAASPEAWQRVHGVIKVVDPAFPGVVIVDGAGPLEPRKELRYSDYPMPADAIELKDALSKYFEQQPQEWQKLIETAQVRWEKQKVADTVIEFCLHQQKESNLKRTFREYQAALTIWFRRQKSFDSQKQQPTHPTPQTPPPNYISQTRH